MPDAPEDYAIRLRDDTVYTLKGETGKWEGPDPATVRYLNLVCSPDVLWSPPHTPILRTCANHAANVLEATREFPPLPPLPEGTVS